MKRESRAFYSTVVVTAFGYVAQVLSLFAIPLYLRTIGTENYGLMVTVAAFMGYLNFADAGLSWGSMILVAQAAGRQDKGGVAHIVRHSVVLALGSGMLVLLALGGLLAFAAGGVRLPMFAAHPEADGLLAIAGLQLVASLQFGIVYNLFQGLQESYWAGLYQGVARLLGIAGGMVVALVSGSVVWVMALQVAVTVAAGLAATVHAWRLHPWAFRSGSWFDRAQYAVQLRVGLKNFLLQIGRTLAGTAPTLAISSIAGPAAVPLYTVPLTLLGLFFVPVNSWSANMQGAYGEAWAAGERVWVKEAFRSSLLRALVAGGLGLALFFALGDGFVRLWTHGRLSVEPALAASVAAVVLTGALLAAGQYLLTGLNRHGRASLAELANGFLALGLVVGSVKWLGVAGAGLGVVLAALLSSVWVLRRAVVAQLGVDCFPPVSAIAKTVVGAAAGCTSAWLAMAWVAQGQKVPGAMALGAGALVGFGVFGALVLALGVLPVELLRDLASSLKRRLAGLFPRAGRNFSI